MTVAQGATLSALAELVRGGGVCALTGAGLSTESGIPDYRGATGRARPATPMTYQEFVGEAASRQRYWARSHAGWQRIAEAVPNAGHAALATLQRSGLISGVITQNVDGLHQSAGSADVIELHGALRRVICLQCHVLTSRVELDARLRAANPHFMPLGDSSDSDKPDSDKADAVKPDGDVDLTREQVSTFTMVDCLDCGAGMLKPDVVFFGEFVPPQRVVDSYDLVRSCRALLVLGSSLTVASGFRFVRRAADLDIPVVIINDGQTRGDRIACLKLSDQLGTTLSALSQEVTR